MEPERAREELRLWISGGATPRPGSGAAATALAAAAEEQGLTGLLLHALPDEEAGWPADVRDRLRTRAHWLLARGVRQLDLAARVCDLLDRRGLRALPLKGAALLDLVYASPADRPMADVDLLVLEGWTEAFRVLQDQGYREVGRADHAAALQDPQGAGHLELHWSVTSCPGLFPAARGLWERARGTPRRPSPEDLLVQLALHAAFQHGLVLSLIQWLDFRRLLARAPDLGLAAEIAREVHGQRALALALAAAALVVGAPPVSPPLAAAPLALVVPSVPRLAQRRWDVAAGRRARLLRGTLLPHVPDAPRGRWSRAGLGLRRLRAVLPQLRRHPRSA
jgi:hypothetical protein